MSKEIEIWIKKIISLGIIAIICYIIYLTQNIISMLVISGFLTLLITPLVEKWKKHKIPEWITICFVYICIIFLVVVVFAAIIPIIINYLVSITTQIIEWSKNAQEIFLQKWIAGFNLPHWMEKWINFIFDERNINTLIDLIKQNAWTIQKFLTTQLSSITSGSVSIVSTIGSTITNWFMIGIITFFMILERNSIWEVFLNLTPEKYEDYFRRIYKKIQIVCISWIRATAILGFSIFAMTYIGLTIAELIFGFNTESKFTLALISGIMEFIPYIGPILSVIPAIIIGLGIGVEPAIVMLILYIIIQQSENNFLVPYIMSKNLDISPLFVFVIMLFATMLGGVLGIILAVPIAGVIKVIYADYLEHHKNNYQPKEPHIPEIPKIPKFQNIKNYIANKINKKTTK